MSKKLASGLVFGALALGAVAVSWTTAKAGRAPLFSGRVVPLSMAATTGNLGNQVSFANGFAPVVKKDLPAVVNIASSKIVRSNPNSQSFFSDPLFREFFGNSLRRFQVPQEQREHSLGSGVIISQDGYVLTNNHVVNGASDIKVSLSDKRDLAAKIVGTDPKTDLAVVKVDAKGLPVLAMGDSSKLQVGDFCLAIGDPFGVGKTVTMGIISATGRGGLGIEDYEDFIQTDAAINPGNSGGALVNVNGDLVGINTAIVSGGSGGNQGVGFAIPVNMAHQVTDQILKHGKVVRGSLGVIVEPVTPALAKAFRLQGEPRGALISQVEPDSGAARAGLQKGDIILRMDGERVADSRSLSLKISMMAPGTTVKLDVFRDQQQREITATLGELESAGEKSGQGESQGGAEGPPLGISVQGLTPMIERQLNLPAGTTGVVVTDVQSGSTAEEAGIRSGDVIQEVNHKPVKNVDELRSDIRQGGSQPVLLLIQRGSEHVFVVVEHK